jgi:translation initiation factor 2 subunit 3
MSNNEIQINYSSLLQNQGLVTIMTLGHVAHGKSTLVRAITGIKTQKHKAELERNITINLGYANAKIWFDKKENRLISLPSSASPYSLTNLEEQDRYELIQHISFLDAPGHQDLMSTMISGTHNFDIAFLLIAGNDKVMPQSQTYEHLLALAAVKKKLDKGLILHNKLDLISLEETKLNKKKIDEFVDGSPAMGLPIVPICAQNGLNVEQVLRYVVSVSKEDTTIKELESKINEPAQLVIIRSFNINKSSTNIDNLEGGIIGGSLRCGYLRTGDIVEIRPGIVSKSFNADQKVDEWCITPLLARVISMSSETSKIDIAVPGGLIGVGLSIDPGLAKNNKLVGQVCSKVGHGLHVYHTLVLEYKRMARPLIVDDAESKNSQEQDKGKENDSKTGKLLLKGEKIKVCVHATSAFGTVVAMVGKKQAKVKLEIPICFGKTDNIVIMREVDGRWHLSGTATLISADEVTNITLAPEYADICSKNNMDLTKLVIIDDINKGTTSILPPFENDYDCLLKNIFPSSILSTLMSSNASNNVASSASNLTNTRMEIIPPKLKPHNRITMWINFAAVMQSLQKGYPSQENNPSRDLPPPNGVDGSSLVLHRIKIADYLLPQKNAGGVRDGCLDMLYHNRDPSGKTESNGNKCNTSNSNQIQFIPCQNHFLKFLSEELACTYSINAKEELLINGKFRDGNLEKIIRNYVLQYRTCLNCHKVNSYLYKDRNHLTTIHCNSCQAERTIKNTST